MNAMAATMPTPTEIETAPRPPSLAHAFAQRWRRVPFALTRRNVVPWLAVKALLTAAVFFGQMGVWTAFAVDTVVSLAVVAYGWRLARR